MMTETLLLLKSASRFGQDPTTWIDSLTPAWKRQLIGLEIVLGEIELTKPRSSV